MPVVTPVAADKKTINFDALRSNIEFLLDSGVHGIVALGSNSEFASMTLAMRRSVLREVAEAVLKHKRSSSVTLLAGTGGNCELETHELNNEAKGMGYDGVMIVSPSYYRTMIDDALVAAYHTRIADASPLPVLLYNIPQFTGGLNFSVSLIAKLASHWNIVGVKDSTGNVIQLGEFVQAARQEEFSIVVGSASALLPGLMYGCTAGVLAAANFMPDLLVRMYDLFKRGMLAEAMALQNIVLAANQQAGKYGIAGVKTFMDARGLHGGHMLVPLASLSADTKEKLTSDWKKSFQSHAPSLRPVRAS